MKLRIAALVALLVVPVEAQEHRHGHSPYSGMQQRDIKALSNEQIADLQTGRGMGLALAAELNGYPGPLHGSSRSSVCSSFTKGSKERQ